jgi:hypothetical protein
MNTPISLQVEIPEILHEALRSYLELRPDWDQDRVLTASLSLFLLQNRSGDSALESGLQRHASRIYLDTLFKQPVGQLS